MYFKCVLAYLWLLVKYTRWWPILGPLGLCYVGIFKSLYCWRGFFEVCSRWKVKKKKNTKKQKTRTVWMTLAWCLLLLYTFLLYKEIGFICILKTFTLFLSCTRPMADHCVSLRQNDETCGACLQLLPCDPWSPMAWVPLTHQDFLILSWVAFHLADTLEDNLMVVEIELNGGRPKHSPVAR